MNDPIIGVRTTTYSLRKKKFDLHLTLCTKINSRWATFFFLCKLVKEKHEGTQHLLKMQNQCSCALSLDIQKHLKMSGVKPRMLWKLPFSRRRI